MMSTDFMIPVVLAGGHHGRGNQGIELLLAAGILAKLLRKKGGGGHHHHHHHGHHHGRSAAPPHYGSGTVEVVHVAPPMGGYSSHYPTTAQSYGPAGAATTSFSASIEYPFSASMPGMTSASHAMPVQHLPYGGPSSAASFIGYDPQPVQYFPPVPLPESASPISP